MSSIQTSDTVVSLGISKGTAVCIMNKWKRVDDPRSWNKYPNKKTGVRDGPMKETSKQFQETGQLLQKNDGDFIDYIVEYTKKLPEIHDDSISEPVLRQKFQDVVNGADGHVVTGADGHNVNGSHEYNASGTHQYNDEGTHEYSNYGTHQYNDDNHLFAYSPDYNVYSDPFAYNPEHNSDSSMLVTDTDEYSNHNPPLEPRRLLTLEEQINLFEEESNWIWRQQYSAKDIRCRTPSPRRSPPSDNPELEFERRLSRNHIRSGKGKAPRAAQQQDDNTIIPGPSCSTPLDNAQATHPPQRSSSSKSSPSHDPALEFQKRLSQSGIRQSGGKTCPGRHQDGQTTQPEPSSPRPLGNAPAASPSPSSCSSSPLSSDERADDFRRRLSQRSIRSGHANTSPSQQQNDQAIQPEPSSPPPLGNAPATSPSQSSRSSTSSPSDERAMDFQRRLSNNSIRSGKGKTSQAPPQGNDTIAPRPSSPSHNPVLDFHRRSSQHGIRLANGNTSLNHQQDVGGTEQQVDEAGQKDSETTLPRPPSPQPLSNALAIIPPQTSSSQTSPPSDQPTGCARNATSESGRPGQSTRRSFQGLRRDGHRHSTPDVHGPGQQLSSEGQQLRMPPPGFRFGDVPLVIYGEFPRSAPGAKWTENPPARD